MSNELYIGEFEELVLLAILHLSPNAYGASIQEALEDAGRKVAIGALYTTLSRLEDKGLLTSSFSEPIEARGGRPKKLFKLEGEGEQALQNANRVRVNLTTRPRLALEGG
jgi:PadR family transcriptional regulator, regulatory protein PadR